MNPPLHIDEDIRKARTLPSSIYFDPKVYEESKNRVFARSWQPVAEAARLKAPGHVLPVTLLDGSISEPLVVTRDADGTAHCLSNVCTHRGTLVVEGEGHLQTLRCRYHGRRFDLNGCLRSAPGFEDAQDFPTREDDLPSLALHEWGPLFFTSLDPMCDFEKWIRPIKERVDWMHPERFVLHEEYSSEYKVPANWALYCDNYLEGFHVPYVHAASLGGKLDLDEYSTELFDWSNVQVAVARGGEPSFDLPRGHPDEGRQIAAWYFWLFPNIMLNFYPWGLSLNVVQPLGPTRTRVLFRSYVSDESKISEGAGADLHRVEMEDEEIVESAQKGVQASLYDRGRYSPAHEKGPHHFHRLLSRALTPTKP
jgi:choline monooxygenase